jgi:hypothetical protein
MRYHNFDDIKRHFGFDIISQRYNYIPITHPELADIRKRVKRKYSFATFARFADDTLAIKLTPASLCWDVIVRYVREYDGYVVRTVSTNRERGISYGDRRRYEVGYDEVRFANITRNINRVMKLIYDTCSITTETVLNRSLDLTVDPFKRGLKNAQDKLTGLKREMFQAFDLSSRDDALLEYCLAGIEKRAVRADIQHNIEKVAREYVKKKADLGESVTASEGLQVLSLYKLQDDHRVFYHYEGTNAGGMILNKHVNDVNKLPQEVLSKLAVLQATGIDAMDPGIYGRCSILNGIGAIGRAEGLGFVEDTMCVYITPETMAEVEALAR